MFKNKLIKRTKSAFLQFYVRNHHKITNDMLGISGLASRPSDSASNSLAPPLDLLAGPSVGQSTLFISPCWQFGPLCWLSKPSWWSSSVVLAHLHLLPDNQDAELTLRPLLGLLDIRDTPNAKEILMICNLALQTWFTWHTWHFKQ